MNHKLAISFENVSKSFNVWVNRPYSLKALLTQLTKLQFSFGHKKQVEVLSGISLEIRAGDFVGVMGKNGVGKSTLLKLISKIYLPSSGQINVNGRLIPLLELGAGFIMDLTGKENIYLNASILGYTKKETEEQIDAIIQFADIGDNINQPVRSYSSGMLVRLGFAVAAHFRADILLFDEILAVGDIGFQNKCLAKIAELHSQGRTIVLVTHDPEQVVKHCNRCIVIDKSGVLFDGSPSEGVNIYRGMWS